MQSSSRAEEDFAEADVSFSPPSSSETFRVAYKYPPHLIVWRCHAHSSLAVPSVVAVRHPHLSGRLVVKGMRNTRTVNYYGIHISPVSSNCKHYFFFLHCYIISLSVLYRYI